MWCWSKDRRAAGKVQRGIEVRTRNQKVLANAASCIKGGAILPIVQRLAVLLWDHRVCDDYYSS